MSSSKIPSPARSQGVISTPRRHRLRRSYSVGSPANTLTKLSNIGEEYRMSPFVSSPLRSRRSVLSDNTYIDVPARESWFKRLDDNTREVIEVLERREETKNVEEYINVQILSQEKKNFTIDLPESSDDESISSIVIPQRKLFSLKDNLQTQKLFDNVIGNRENFTLRKSKSNNDKTIVVGKKNLFNRGTKERSKSIFPGNMQNVVLDSTLPDKTKEIENQGKTHNLFGNRIASKRKNMFSEFIVSESEDEIPDIQPKVFVLPTNKEQQLPQVRNRQSTIQRVENVSVDSIISNDELDGWNHLPSSTMVENVSSFTEKGTPLKRARLSVINKTRTLTVDTDINVNTVNKSKQSPLTANNALRSKFANDNQFVVSRNSCINEYENSEAALNKSNKNLTRSNNSDEHNTEMSINIQNPSDELNKIEGKQNVSSDKIKLQTCHHDSHKDSSSENIDENDFTLQYEDNEENSVEERLDENNVTIQNSEHDNSSASRMNNGTKQATILKSDSTNNTIETNLNKSTDVSINDKSEKESPVSEMRNKTLLQVNLNEDNDGTDSFEAQNQNKNPSSSSKVVVVEREDLPATNIQKNCVGDNENLHSSPAVNLSESHAEKPKILDEDNNRNSNCSSHSLGNDSNKNISHRLMNEDEVNNTILDNIELVRNQMENKSCYKSINVNMYHKNNHDGDDKIDDIVMEIEGSHENIINFKDNTEESGRVESDNLSEDENGDDNEKNYESNESSRNITEPERTCEEDEIIHTKTDTEDQSNDIENEVEDKSEDDNIGDSNTNVEDQQEEENENSKETEQNYSSENQNDDEDSEDDNESNIKNPEDDDEVGEDSDGNEMENESTVNEADEQNTTAKSHRLEQNSGISEQSSSIFRNNVTEESDHNTSTNRRAVLKMYLMNMKKANMEKKRQNEVAIRNSIKASAPLREFNLFKVPTKPKSSHRPQIKTSQAKPKMKHLSTLENLPPELLKDLQYKPPRRYQPSNAAWITKRLYKYLEDKLEPKYDYKARVKAEKLVETINNFARELRRYSVASPDAVIRLKEEMAQLGITKTHYDFYEFFHEFMPREVRVKVVPDIVNKISLPKHGVFSDILS